jgi:hypothetical protein
MQRYLVILFYFCFFLGKTQAKQLSKSATISVLTVDSGTELYDAFGHSAFRIKDPETGLDDVYGYGAYDFNAPNFYLKFTQGKLNYLLSKTDFARFYRTYEYYKRSIHEQVLNFSPEERQKLYSSLVTNYKPEHRGYLYDFFFDNCATKIKDVTRKASNSEIAFTPPDNYKPVSFRTLIQDNLNKNSWGSFGIDLALGAVIDRIATPEEHMFLPKNINTFFGNAKFANTNSPLVQQSKVIFNAQPAKKQTNFFTSPLFVLSLLACIIIYVTYRDYKRYKATKILDVLIFGSTAVIGIVLLLLWFATDHGATKNNYNLLWANALNIVMLIPVIKAYTKPWMVSYIKFCVILLCLLIFHWITGVQVFAITLLPLVIALLIRYIFLAKHYNAAKV